MSYRLLGREPGGRQGSGRDERSHGCFFLGTLESELCDVACGMFDETMDLACLGLCIRFRGGSASSVWKSEGAMTMMASEWSWHAVAIAPLEMRRRRVRRSAGVIVNGSEAERCEDSDSDRILDSGVSSASSASESGEDRPGNVDEDGHRPIRRVQVHDASEECVWHALVESSKW
jgi:hypothetical protein